jgi:hypothetical protein
MSDRMTRRAITDDDVCEMIRLHGDHALALLLAAGHPESAVYRAFHRARSNGWITFGRYPSRATLVDDAEQAAFLADQAARRQAYLVWRDGLLAAVGAAIDVAHERAKGRFGHEAGNLHELNRNLFKRAEMVLTAESETRDEDGHLIALPGSRHLCRWLIVQLAVTYGVEVPERP